MIKFFRKIRKELAANNQFFKYSKYAIGEIALVMIGILLALQVNNWNEVKKQERRKEVVMRSLTFELNEVLSYTLSQRNMMDTRIELFTKILNEWETFDPNLLSEDSLNQYYWYIHTETLLKYNPRIGFYNSLISSGEINYIPDSTVVKLNYVYDSQRRDIVTYVNQEVNLHLIIAEVVARNHSEEFLSGRVRSGEELDYFQQLDVSTIINFLKSIKSDGELKSLLIRNLFIIKTKKYILDNRIIPQLNDLLKDFEKTS